MAAMTAKFCSACGVALPPAARFCAGCGAAVISVAAPASAPEGERRPVTVMFADLTAFTRLASERDPEEVHRLLNRLFEVVDGLVDAHGGTVDKHIGDGVMAVFGAPVAHDNDPERAIRTALALHAATAELGADEGLPLSLHIGINSGEVVASNVGSGRHGSYTVTGDAVNLASRLQEIAKPGETLITDAVRRAVEGLVAVEAKGSVEVRGLERPIGIWRVERLRDNAPATTNPLVGRQNERRQFQAALETCLETSHGGTVHLRGEAGIGKTRVVEEFRALASARGFDCHTGLVLDFGVGKGRDAIRAVVRSLLGLPPESDKEQRRAVADSVVATGPMSPDQVPFVYDLLDLPQPVESRRHLDAMNAEARRRGLRETVAGLVTRASASRGQLVVLEDLHWADPTALDTIAVLIGTVAECRAILVITSRIEGDPTEGPWRAAVRGGPVMTIDLPPLRREDAETLARGLAPDVEGVISACVERAEGNPLFLVQLVRELGERTDASLPPSIQSVVLARMDRLAAQDKAALQAASVIGQRFDMALLREILGDQGYQADNLVRHYLVRPEGDEIMFAHALIRDGVYSSLLNATKRRLHGRVAAWLADRDPILRAQHLERAEDAGAAAAYADAARSVAAAYRFDQALDLADSGLRVARTDGDRSALEMLKGIAHRELGRPEDSLAAFKAALELAPEDLGRGRALMGIAAAHRMTGATAEARDALIRAETMLGEQSPQLERAQLFYYMGSIAFALGETSACLEHHQRSLVFAEAAGDLEWQARALSGLGDAFYAQGRVLTAETYFVRCIELASANGFGRIELSNRAMLSTSGYYRLDLDASFAEVNRGLEMARAVGDRHGEMINLEERASVWIELGDSERALNDLGRAEALAREIGAKRFLTVILSHTAWASIELGDFARARHVLREALSLARETGEGFLGPTVLVWIASATDDATEREQALAEAEAILAKGAIGHNYIYFYRFGMETALKGREWERALRYADALEAYLAAEPLPLTTCVIEKCRAMVRWGRGPRDEETRAELRRLLTLGRDMRWPWFVTRIEAALDA